MSSLDLTMLDILHTYAALTVEQEPRGLRISTQRQVRSL